MLKISKVELRKNDMICEAITIAMHLQIANNLESTSKER